LGNLGVDGKIILNCILKLVKYVNWIYLSKAMDQWRVMKYTILKLLVP
jgi:hypothetical protein